MKKKNVNIAREMNLHVSIKGYKPGMSLDEVRVPAIMRQRRKSGLKWFDESMGEGFVPSTMMLLTGTPGIGKSTMFLQIADALQKSGHSVLFNTNEESLYQSKMVAERLKLENKFAVGEEISCKRLLELADTVSKAGGKKQMFLLVDSLQGLDDCKYANGYKSGNTTLRCTEMLTDWAKDTNGIVITIGQTCKNGDFAGKQTIFHAVDVRAQFNFDTCKKSDTYGERIFQIVKNRFGIAGVTHIMDIGSEGVFEKYSVDQFKNMSVVGSDDDDEDETDAA